MGTTGATFERGAVAGRTHTGPLAGRTAVVMGASPDLGTALADALTARGAEVVFGEGEPKRPGSRGTAAFQKIENQIAHKLDKAHEDLGHIDVLVTAATLPAEGDHTPARPRPLFESQVPSHLVGTWCAAHAAARLMAADGRGGEIVIVCKCGGGASAETGDQAPPLSEAMLARDLARCFRPSDVRVNVLALGRDAVAEDLVDSLLMLVSEAADPVSGTTLMVDGARDPARR